MSLLNNHEQPIFAEYNRKQKEDPSKYLDLDDPAITKTRCAFKRVQIYEHIDDLIRENNVFKSWMASNDSHEKEYVVVYPSKEDIEKMDEEARELNKAKRQEKVDRWEKRRKVKKNEDELEEDVEGVDGEEEEEEKAE